MSKRQLFVCTFIVAIIAIGVPSCYEQGEIDREDNIYSEDNIGSLWKSSVETNEFGGTVAVSTLEDGSVLTVISWASGRMTGKFVPSAQADAEETIYFEAAWGDMEQHHGEEADSYSSDTHIVDVRLIDSEGRTFAVSDGGPTNKKSSWEDPLATGLVAVADLENQEEDREPLMSGDEESVRQLETARIQEKRAGEPGKSSAWMTANDPPLMDGIPEDVIERIWSVGKYCGAHMSGKLSEQEQPMSAELEIPQMSFELPFNPIFCLSCIHRATSVGIYSTPPIIHTGLIRERQYLYFGNFTFTTLFAADTCNHGRCAMEMHYDLTHFPYPANGGEVCTGAWQNRPGAVKGIDWNGASPEPSIGYCGPDFNGWGLGGHVCNDDTYLQFMDIKENTYHHESTESRCNSSGLRPPPNAGDGCLSVQL